MVIIQVKVFAVYYPSIYIPNKKGFGDTLRVTERQTVMVPIPSSRHVKFGSFADTLGEYPIIRSIIGTVSYILWTILANRYIITHQPECNSLLLTDI